VGGEAARRQSRGGKLRLNVTVRRKRTESLRGPDAGPRASVMVLKFAISFAAGSLANFRTKTTLEP
jgi:hypothetical protein